MAGGDTPKKPRNGEQWRFAVLDSRYEVSDLGRVRRSRYSPVYPGKLIAGCVTSQGYRVYTLRNGDERKLVKGHRLVCEAFHGPAPSALHEVAHNDGNRSNNVASNLRWATHADNLADRKEHGTSLEGERNGRAKLTRRDVNLIRMIYDGRHGQIALLARAWEVSHSAMRSVCVGEHWK